MEEGYHLTPLSPPPHFYLLPSWFRCRSPPHPATRGSVDAECPPRAWLCAPSRDRVETVAKTNSDPGITPGHDARSPAAGHLGRCVGIQRQWLTGILPRNRKREGVQVSSWRWAHLKEAQILAEKRGRVSQVGGNSVDRNAGMAWRTLIWCPLEPSTGKGPAAIPAREWSGGRA